MVLYLVGLGLGDLKDITVKGLEVVKNADKIFLEAYTSLLVDSSVEEMETFYGKALVLADREMVEENADEILKDADVKNVAFLVVGDPLSATTHTDLILRANQLKVPYQIIHNTSIMTAVSSCGLQLYNFGETVSIVSWTDSWKPDSCYDKISLNLSRGLHTLCLLDIKIKERSTENIIKGKRIYEPAKFMRVNEAAKQLIEIIENRRESCSNFTPAYSGSTTCVGLARLGSVSQQIVVSTLSEMCDEDEVDLGPPLHSLVVPGHVHPVESDMLTSFISPRSNLRKQLPANS